ncbi:cytochrome b6-f complex subunit chloroplastic [Raphidocelis subcapitata]|uniref:Cytochrome b6-f complex subunit chloroplastic n=1 Tax=Raphidocelis subcapitata TaxID=307507 RepID=A0A2V0PLK3_9CHLO|nr:cytochrome b6-f complex subunit chloroplastic [Raphidocelis subcapitata]|eukprot:GBF98720.1 cytochrome b6-f complex subunit chloroplastic [Raphidocelis subcapitata]
MALSQLAKTCSSRAAARAVSSGARPVLPAVPKPAVRAARRVAPASRAATVAPKALPMEVAQVAGEAGFIGGVALTMAAITLVGLAIGFVLLRVESLAEEGKL